MMGGMGTNEASASHKKDLSILNAASADITQQAALRHFTNDVEAEVMAQHQELAAEAAAREKHAQIEEDGSDFEDDFVVVNGQISRVFAPGIDLYLGVENILNYRQQNPIVAAQLAYEDEQMFQENMDASLVYGPIFGRMVYVGGRLTLGKADNAKP